jgi:release factor glutamine methyltransferase
MSGVNINQKTKKMQNKPNLRNDQINTTPYMARRYKNFTRHSVSEGGPIKPNQTQNKPNSCEPFLFSTYPRHRYNLSMQDWTIQKLLNWTADYFTEKGIDCPRLSAELLLSHVLETRRIELYTQFDKPVEKQQLDTLHELVRRAAEYEPIAYLTGKTEFYSLELFITRDCLIPRPETELLVARAIEFLRSATGQQSVCDLCTGSGCIAAAIAKNVPNAAITATDISDAALEIAARNIEKHGLSSRVKLLCGDLFDPVIPELDTGKFDLIVCNPPYVSSSEFEKLDRNVKDYEPKAALSGGMNGLDIYCRIVEKAEKFLKPDGAIMLEIGYRQGQAVREILEQAGYLTDIKIEKDHHDNDRIAMALRTPNRE